MKKYLSAFLIMILLGCLFTGCVSEVEKLPVQADAPQLTLRVSASWKDFPAMEWAANEFNKKNPNCTVVYEYLQGDYHDVLKERMLAEGDDRVDIFITTSNIQESHALNGYAMDLLSCKGLDLSKTFPSLLENAMYIEPDGSAATKLFALPLGAQMRGLFVNMSLLKKVGIESVPTNQAELLTACAALKAAGYVPFHGDPGPFAQQLLYPWICNKIANAEDYDKVYTMVNTRDPAATELFREIYEFLYTLIENDYYDYNYSQKTLKLCVDTTTSGLARDFLNIVETAPESGEYEKGEGEGQIAFLPNAISLLTTLDKMKADYHSDIEYVFVPAPLGVDGGFVYLSPADMIGINKETEKAEWAANFLNFLFTPEINEVFAQKFSIIPNTADAFHYVSGLYDVPTNHISELGQATFDWGFYRVLTRSTKDEVRALPAISKANSPDCLDPETGKIYPFEHFWAQFQSEFTSLE